GAAALVRQFLVVERQHVKPGEKPSSALVRAVLVNGASAMKGQFTGEIPAVPNSVCGFGRVDVATALGAFLFDDEPDHAVGTGEMRVFDVTAADTTKPLKLTLAWTDAPAAVNFGGLTNSLYLQLVTPGGQIIDGEIDAFPNAVNNVQQVLVRQPQPGTYTVRVRGVSIVRHSPIVVTPARPKQNFALVVANAASLQARS